MLTIVPKTPSGGSPSSGSIAVYATQRENTPSFIDTTEFDHDFAAAVPVGGMTVNVTIRE